MLKSSLDLHQSARTGHGLELVLQATSLEAVRNSFVNSVRRIWNELSAEVATTHDLRQFKRLKRSPEVYAALSIRNVIRKVESNL
uniref:Transposase n=1 Tax=Acrobeloides nanus TaxID=290746 RepID=A0A914EH91_9BILA